MLSDDRRKTLGEFIRVRREQATPLRPTPRRRTPGMRREELAEAAGLGVTWIAWLEQGRDVNASASALSRLSDALKLNRAERASLFDLAGRKDPRLGEAVHSPMADRVDSLLGALSCPAYALDAMWNVFACNAEARALFAGWLDVPDADRNLLSFVFQNPLATRLIVGWESRARRLLAEFRADFNRHLDSPAAQALVESLCASSPFFAKIWRAHDVSYREGGTREFLQPMRGLTRYTQFTLAVVADPGTKVVALVPDALLSPPTSDVGFPGAT